MELESIMLNELSQRQIAYHFTHMWNLRNKINDQRGKKKKREKQMKKQMLNYKEQTVVIRGEMAGGTG